MTAGKKRLLGKLLEAAGLAALVIGLSQGLHGDAWGELYLFLGGIFVFLVGRQVEKQPVKADEPMEIKSNP